MHLRLLCRSMIVVCCVLSLVATESPAEEPQTGPATEKRFPPLVVPAGFKATLFACDPLVEYPSVIALGPRAGSLFVAHDYLTGLGTDIVRRDEVRLLSDSDGDGYADKSVVYAGGFNSIQGLAYHAGTVYVMHAPLLTALQDTDGDGIADERRDLLNGLGLTPEKNLTRLHCANGVTVGHDGWLYLSMGDNGTDVLRPEGDRLLFQAGGILRCRPSGRDLHVFASGLRNIYDVALDEQLNVFVRDNENDGGDYLLRIYHSYYGADHGYPYLYREHPDEAVQPLADLGRGSSAGGVCYLETAFPTEMHGSLFFCEWGRAVVRAERHPAGGSFAATKETDFAAGAATDPYGFKPTDVVVDRDGSLLISDWCDGQRPKRGRGRIYRVTYSGKGETPRVAPAVTDQMSINDWLVQLDSPSDSTRVAAQTALERLGRPALDAIRQAIRDKKLNVMGRLHAVWLLASLGGRDSIEDLFAITESDPDIVVRAQAVRAIADLTDPKLIEHRLDAGPGDHAVAVRLAALARNQDPKVLLEVVSCLGRLKWSGAPAFLRDAVRQPDAALAHAAQQTLRRAGNWPAVLTLLDEPNASPIREIAMRAVADQWETVIVDGLIDRLRRESGPQRRQQYAVTLTRIYKKPSPWVYWGYRPPPRPANTVAWERTEDIAAAVNRTLADPDRDVRAAVLKQMLREQVPVQLSALSDWLRDERNEIHVALILDSLAMNPASEVRSILELVIQERSFADPNRARSLATWISKLDVPTEPRLLELATKVEDGIVLEKLLSELGRRPQLESRRLLLTKLDSPTANIRAAALVALSQLQTGEAAARVPALLADPAVQVRRAAASAAGKFGIKTSVTALLALASDVDPETRSASLDALRQLQDSQAVSAAVSALNHPASQAAAIEYLAEFGGPDQAAALVAVASTSRSSETLGRVVQALANWESAKATSSLQMNVLRAAVAGLQGESGTLLRWQALEKLSPTNAAQAREKILLPAEASPDQPASGWRSVLAAGLDQRVELGVPGSNEIDAVWLAYTDVSVAEPAGAQFLASSTGTLQVWLNGKLIHERPKSGSFQPDSDRFEAQLNKGLNRVVVQVGTAQGLAQFHVRFRRRGSSAEHERLAQFALQDSGNIERGRELFFNAEKTLCMKCHRLLDQGGRIGPDLTGIGSRFARIHLIESILEPSRTIAPSYETVTTVLTSGRVVTGVKVAETDVLLTLGDETGKTHEIPKSEVDERITQPRSTMPDGLEKRITDREFLDLLTFLLSQKKPVTR
ncbi:MAG: putative rane-bound dehydrogenase [Planctomycetaceae bacterium]|nr:putative rane-bound dehydrogenase [Planctomycetaceae bacterium]